MGIEGIGNGQVAWQSFLTNVQDAQSITQIGGIKQHARTQQTNLTVEEGTTVRQVAVSVPELSAPTTVDSFGLATLSAKLTSANALSLTEQEAEALQRSLDSQMASLQSAAADAGVSVSSSSNNGVFFNLYQLMALLAAVAQELRDSTREIRAAESQAIQTSIQNQAEQQKTAALTGLISGGICCALQVGCTIGGLAKQAKAFGTQMGEYNNSGLNRAQANLKMAEMTASQSDAAKHFQSMTNKVGDSVAAEVRASFDNSHALGVQHAEAQAQVAGYERTQQTLGEVPGERPANMAQAKAEAASALESAQKRVEQTSQAKTQAQEALTKTTDELNAATETRDIARGSLERTRQELQTLQGEKTAVEGKIQALRGQLEGDPGATVEGLQREISGHQETIDSAKAELKGVQTEMDRVGAKIDETRTNIDGAQQAKADLRGEVQSLEAEKAEVETSIANAKELLASDTLSLSDDAKAKLQSSIEADTAKLGELQTKIAGKQDAIHEMDTLIRSKQDTLAELQTQQENLEARAGQLETRIDLTSADLQSAQQRLNMAGDAVVAHEQVRGEISTLEARQGELQGKIDAKHDQIATAETVVAQTDARVEALTAQKQTQTEALAQATQEAQTAETALHEASERWTTLDKMDSIDTANREIDGARARAEDLRKQCIASVKSEASQARSEYEAAQRAADNPPEGATRAEKAALKQTAAELKTKAEYAEAYAAKELSGLMTSDEKLAMQNQAESAYQAANTRLTSSQTFVRAQHISDQARAYNDLIAALGNFGQSMAQSVANTMNAEATRMSADEKAAEEELAQISDLFQGAGDLANAVLQLMQSVQQSENDSMQEAIRA